MGWDTEWPDEDNTRVLCARLRDAFRGDWHYGTTGGNCSAVMCNGFSAGEPVVLYIATDAVAPVLGSDTLTYVSMSNECGDWSDEWPVFESLDGNDEQPLRLETVVDAVGRFIGRYGFVPFDDESDRLSVCPDCFGWFASFAGATESPAGECPAGLADYARAGVFVDVSGAGDAFGRYCDTCADALAGARYDVTVLSRR